MLEAVDLACRRGGHLVFEALGLTLADGEALLLRGANGSGKTSLLRLLAGFQLPATGNVNWSGSDIRHDLATHRARLHYLGFQNALPPALTAREALLAAAGLLGARPPDPDLALERMGLAGRSDTSVRWLSSGQRRRLALARLLAAPRLLWLLDEPLVGLDRAGRGLVEAMVASHRAMGGIAVLASHDEIALPDCLILDLSR